MHADRAHPKVEIGNRKWVRIGFLLERFVGAVCWLAKLVKEVG